MSTALLPLIGYFLLIGSLLFVINPFQTYSTRPNNAIYYRFLSLCAVLVTWTYMFLYFQWSFYTSKLLSNLSTGFSIDDWLSSTSLFEQAWYLVCSKPERWWFSQQLCLWTTGPLTIFLFRESNKKGRFGIKPWAYMLLGQVVAISFAQTLFFAELEQLDSTTSAAEEAEEEEEEEKPNWLLCTCVYSSIAAVALSPTLIHTPYFLPNLLLFHVLILLPLVSNFNSLKEPMSYQTLYFSTAFFSFLTIIPTYTTLFPFLLSTPILTTLVQLYHLAYETLFIHPAQSSISFDVIFTTLSMIVWILLDFIGKRKLEMGANWKKVLVLILMTPILGISVTGSLYLGFREGKVSNRRKLS